MLELKNLTIYRGSLCTADAVNASFEKGKVYSVLGPNGAGKNYEIGRASCRERV